LAKSPKVVAIGEIGLDYHYLPQERSEELKTKQKEVFLKQVDLAQELNLPIIIHCRDAYGDLLEVIQKLPKIPCGVLHCFADNYETAKRFLDLGFMISFTGIITYPKASIVREVAKKIPLERIMIETDCPYLAPQAVRGKRNEPIYVKYVAEEIARLKGLDFDEVAKTTTENAIKFFKLKN
jgi:TatD DNase family protein